jgi:hypothetical protein
MMPCSCVVVVVVNEWKVVLCYPLYLRGGEGFCLLFVVSFLLHFTENTHKKKQIFLEAAKQESKAQQRQAAICYRIKHIFDQSLYSKADNEE